MTDQRDADESTESSENADPMENADMKEPTDPTDRAEPTDPIDSTDPLDPIDRIDPSDHRDHFDVCGSVSVMSPIVPAAIPRFQRHRCGLCCRPNASQRHRKGLWCRSCGVKQGAEQVETLIVTAFLPAL
jgi:hypothetical protein